MRALNAQPSAARGRKLEERLLATGVTVARTDDELLRYHGKFMLVDDELHELFSGIPYGVRLTVISDSCHSGSATRDPGDPFAPDQRRRRFCDPRAIGRPAIPDVRRTARPRGGELYPESGMRELLLSGCRSDQYSYDAHSDVEAVTGDNGNTAATYGYTAYGQDDSSMFTGADASDGSGGSPGSSSSTLRSG